MIRFGPASWDSCLESAGQIRDIDAVLQIDIDPVEAIALHQSIRARGEIGRARRAANGDGACCASDRENDFSPLSMQGRDIAEKLGCRIPAERARELRIDTKGNLARLRA